MAQVRLDKFLAAGGAGTRSEVKQWIRKGHVRINGEVCKKPEQKVAQGADRIFLDEREIIYQQFVYYMLHKPAGYVTAVRDSHFQTVMDLIEAPQKKTLAPVGRLDLDTEGLLLVTNDGELAHRLLSPARHVDKTYFARVHGAVTQEDVCKFREGIDIGDEKPCMPAGLKIISSAEDSEVEVTIQEGRFHQVKRMFQAVGKEVFYLKRLSMGSLVLDETLEKGQYRPLTQEERRLLKEETERARKMDGVR